MGILRNKYLKVKKGIFSVKFFIISCSYVLDIFLQKVYYPISFAKYNKAATCN